MAEQHVHIVQLQAGEGRLRQGAGGRAQRGLPVLSIEECNHASCTFVRKDKYAAHMLLAECTVPHLLLWLKTICSTM